MKSPYGRLDNCMTCPVREQHLFCNLSRTHSAEIGRHYVFCDLSPRRYVVHRGSAGAWGLCLLHREGEALNHLKGPAKRLSPRYANTGTCRD